MKWRRYQNIASKLCNTSRYWPSQLLPWEIRPLEGDDWQEIEVCLAPNKMGVCGNSFIKEGPNVKFCCSACKERAKVFRKSVERRLEIGA